MKIETLEKVLRSNPCIENVRKPEKIERSDFIREFHFDIRGKSYSIEWWKNIMYLHIGEAFIPFKHVTINGCWPDKFKNHLVFNERPPESRFDFPNHVAIIPIEEHKE